MMTFENPIEKQGFFKTPEDFQEIENWIELHDAGTRIHLLTAAMMAWNLASKVIDKNNKPQVLRNGATILQRRETANPNIDVLLCSKPTDNGVEYVTWIQNKEDAASGYDGTYHGHYFNGHYDGDSAWRKANADFWNRS